MFCGYITLRYFILIIVCTLMYLLSFGLEYIYMVHLKKSREQDNGNNDNNLSNPTQGVIPTNPNPTYANYATPIIPPQQVYYGQQPVYYAPVQQPQAQPIYNAQPQNDQYIPPPPSITGNENN